MRRYVGLVSLLDLEIFFFGVVDFFFGVDRLEGEAGTSSVFFVALRLGRSVLAGTAFVVRLGRVMIYVSKYEM